MSVNRDVNRIFEKKRFSANMFNTDLYNIRNITSDGALSIVESVTPSATKTIESHDNLPLMSDVNRYMKSGKITKYDENSFVINKKDMRYSQWESFQFFYAAVKKMAALVNVDLGDQQAKEMSRALSIADPGMYKVVMDQSYEIRKIDKHSAN